MTPAQEIISGAVNDYGNSFVDRAKSDYLHGLSQQQAMAILGAKQAGEEKIEGMRNAGALDRVKAQISGYLDRLDEQELNRQAMDLQKRGVQQQPGESIKDFVLRGTSQAIKQHGNALNSYDDQLSTLAGKRDAAARAEAQRQSELANNLAVQSTFQNLDLGLTTSEKAALARGVGAGLKFNEALTEAVRRKDLASQDRANQILGVYSTQKNLLLPQLQAQKSPEFERTLTDLDRLESGITSKKNALLNSSFGAAAQSIRAANQAAAVFGNPDGTSASADPVTPKPAKPQATTTAGTGTNGAPPAALPMQFLPAALQDPDKLDLVSKYHPRGTDFASDEGNILTNTMAAIQKRKADAQAVLSGMHVVIGQNENGELVPIVPKTQRVVAPFIAGPAMIAPGMAPTMERALSPTDRQTIWKKAQETLSEIKDYDSALEKLKAPAPTPAALDYSDPNSVLSPAPGGEGSDGSY